MSYSIDEAATDCASTAKHLRAAAKQYTGAHHVTGRIWEIEALPTGVEVDVLVTDDGIWPCTWVGRPEDGGVCIRQRRYSLKPSFEIGEIARTAEGKALLLAHMRKR